MFAIEDDRHAEQIGQFGSRDEALVELKRLASVPWDKEPNVAPCSGWRTCGRSYEIVEHDVSVSPWRELGRVAILDVSAEGVSWTS